jgi:hypothetical protein
MTAFDVMRQRPNDFKILEYHSALKRKDILIHTTTWMNLEVIMLNEINHSQKNKCCMTLFI